MGVFFYVITNKFGNKYDFKHLNLLIEKVHLDDLDLYVVTSAVVATSVFL